MYAKNILEIFDGELEEETNGNLDDHDLMKLRDVNKFVIDRELTWKMVNDDTTECYV